MRTLKVLICLILLSFSAKSQILISLLLGDNLNTGKIEFGVDGGINYPDIRGLDGSLAGNFNIGFYFDIKTNNPNWLFHTGVMVKSSLGTDGLPVYSLNDISLDNAFAGGEVQRKINYFNVPMGMKYKLSPRIFVLGGIMPSLRYTAYDFFRNEINGDELEYKVSIKDQIHRLDFGLLGGIGYRLFAGYGMNLTFKYYYGLVDITIYDDTPDQYNTSLYFTIGIPIGVKKAREREQSKQ